ncbi:hypothetical protein [Rhizobium sp. MHM7A]|uniref:hypothetical protein n=1 Tax=Rhizobium sp. MHM7A TaxID=2583233 RepID=UPI001105BDB8|nr:hypothetical protein [Rhizobium sp. MHM7A]TLX16759.1 hypothetical protein FFR93_05290 [Rhizobium sp. MHM7A]
MLTLFRQPPNSFQKKALRRSRLENLALALPFLLFVIMFSLIPLTILLAGGENHPHIPTASAFQ